ncbi:hypothetical protein F511_35111 [Dorcoceras hygrometricum]|uniref:Uncharacterized protein n=1 Tax=Dorcoceras hygrometricum TaxID=472368 RepID=A0A2Z7AQX3_9LAMI|nr:hypothetical protein F511_35111 [Dorcoceras hygrometricum]
MGEYVRIPATNERSSEGVGSVSDEAPPMLKSGERMSKVEMLRALKERKAGPEGASRSLSKGKRKSTEERGEKRKKRQHEQETHESGREQVPKEAIKETSTSGGKGPEQTTEASCEYLDASTISFIAKLSGSASLDFTHRLIPDRDYNLVNSVPDLAALEAASLHLMQEHGGLMKQLEEIQANHDKESEEMALEQESSRTRAFCAKEENKALQAEVDKWKDEAANSWELGKEKFLQSKEFRVLCSGKALAFFEKGFDGCLTQFMESGYTEEEHPPPSLMLSEPWLICPMMKRKKEAARVGRRLLQLNAFCGTGLKCRADRAYVASAELGFEIASAELGLSAELVGLRALRLPVRNWA